MSRIRGIDAKVQNEVLQTRRNGCNESNKKKNEDQSTCPKDEAEKQQIKELLQKLPKLDKIFTVHRKIGEGTFSSVYLGSLRAHAPLPPVERRWFALKHLVPTAHPARIEHELRCLQDIGGKNNVIGVDLCLRHLDTIVFVMPYIPHKKFSEYVGDMTAEEVREYMRALLTALQHVHSFGVIHRDVKPSNFLYDRDNRRYLLVDFGLAQRVVTAPPDPAPASAPAPPAPPPAHHSNALKRPREEDEKVPDAKRMALDLSVKSSRSVSVALPASRRAVPPPPPPRRAVPPPPPPPVTPQTHNKLLSGGGGGGGGGGGVGVSCACAGVGGVCAACSARPPPRAPRAGTQGFRPPEVLLKVVTQTTAVDVWAAGVVLASVLSARYPFFRAPDDAAALAELADLLGTEPLKRTAHALGRRLVTSVSRRGLCLRKLCARLRGGTAPPRRPPPSPARPSTAPARPAPAPAPASCERCRLPSDQCLCADEHMPASMFRAGVVVAGFPDAAFALAARLLEPDPRARPSAAHALQHPFFTQQDQ